MKEALPLFLLVRVSLEAIARADPPLLDNSSLQRVNSLYKGLLFRLRVRRERDSRLAALRDVRSVQRLVFATTQMAQFSEKFVLLDITVLLTAPLAHHVLWERS